MLPHSRVKLRRWFDSHKVGDCVAERGSGSTRDPLEEAAEDDKKIF